MAQHAQNQQDLELKYALGFAILPALIALILAVQQKAVIAETMLGNANQTIVGLVLLAYLFGFFIILLFVKLILYVLVCGEHAAP